MAIKDLFSRFLEAANLNPSIPSVSRTFAGWVAMLGEGWANLTNQHSEPLLTRFVVDQLASEHWFCLDAIRRDLGYCPEVSIELGLLGLTKHLRSVKGLDAACTLSIGP